MKCEGCGIEVAWRDSEGPVFPLKNTWCKDCSKKKFAKGGISE